MEKISYDDIPKYSNAIQKLLENTSVKVKNRKNINREFGLEKWGKLSNVIASSGLLKAIMDSELPMETKLCGIIDRELVLATRDELFKYQINKISSYLSDSKSPTLVEIGSGYGSIILTLAKENRLKYKKIIGVEITKQGVSLGKKISKYDGLKVHFEVGEFMQKNLANNKKIVENADCITSFSLHYVKNPEKAIKNIALQNPNKVLHLEPILQHYSEKKTIGLLQRKYLIKNKYTTNILPALENLDRKKIIKIKSISPCCFGNNPLMPASLIEWEVA